jgi:hypothetical protein
MTRSKRVPHPARVLCGRVGVLNFIEAKTAMWGQPPSAVRSSIARQHLCGEAAVSQSKRLGCANLRRTGSGAVFVTTRPASRGGLSVVGMENAKRERAAGRLSPAVKLPHQRKTRLNQAAGKVRFIKRIANNAPRITSNVRQKPGHQRGTPGFSNNKP